MAFIKKQVPNLSTNQPSTDEEGRAALHEAAVHHVKNQHGPFVTRLDNYDDLVTDAKNQIQAAVEANKTF